MTPRKRTIGRFLLFSFVLRALIPAGLMLQLPAIGAAAESTHQQLGFVICPLQNPGLDLSKLDSADREQNPHAHHHHTSDTDGKPNPVTVSAETADALCSVWASSAETNISIDLQSPAHAHGTASKSNPSTQTFPQTKNISPRLTRAPPFFF